MAATATSAEVFLPGALRVWADGAERVTVSGATVAELIAALEEAHPGLRFSLCYETGELTLVRQHLRQWHECALSGRAGDAGAAGRAGVHPALGRRGVNLRRLKPRLKGVPSRNPPAAGPPCDVVEPACAGQPVRMWPRHSSRSVICNQREGAR